MRKFKKILIFILGISLVMQANLCTFAAELPEENQESAEEISEIEEETPAESEEDLELKAYIEEAAGALEEVVEQSR